MTISAQADTSSSMQELTDNDRRRDGMIAAAVRCGIALLLVGTGAIVSDYFKLESDRKREILVAGELMATAAAASVAERDSVAAEGQLQLLRGEKRVLEAVLYSNGEVKPLARYSPSGRTATLSLFAGPTDKLRVGIQQTSGGIVLVRDVALKGETVGRLAMRVEADDLQPLQERDLAIAVLLLLATGLTELAARMKQLARQLPGRKNDALDGVPREMMAMSNSPSENEMSLNAAVRERIQTEAAEALLALETDASHSEFLTSLSDLLRRKLKGLAGRNFSHFGPNGGGDSAAAALKTMDGLVDFLSLEAGSATLTQDEISLWEMLFEAARWFAAEAAMKHVALVLEIAPDVPRFLTGDRGRLRQAIEKLLENALASCDQGTVTVAARQLFQSDRTAGIHFKIRNTGRGMDAEEFARAVDPFGNGARAGTEAEQDRGLDIAIANRLAALMGGAFWMENEPGRGSTFHFTATFERTDGGSGALSMSCVPSGVRVLVADTDAFTRRTTHQLLLREQIKPALAATGREALELLRAAASARHPFDIVLTDSKMEAGGGMDLAAEIREHPELGSPIIIVLVSLGSVSVTATAHQVSHHPYLAKPVLPAKLRQVIGDAVRTLQAGNGPR